MRKSENCVLRLVCSVYEKFQT